ncbi:MAG TPA: DUF5989 family protein [Gemmataceae bacterium]|jgi:hypothetical protein|nr:DUF5989 family protein [Gemmataceae bacterium]
MDDPPINDLEKAALEEREGSLIWEMGEFLRQNKKWWLVPILIVLFIFGLLIVATATPLAPFIYTLF